MTLALTNGFIVTENGVNCRYFFSIQGKSQPTDVISIAGPAFIGLGGSKVGHLKFTQTIFFEKKNMKGRELCFPT